MGHTLARVKLYNPSDPSKALDLDLLVDAGSTYSWVGRDKLSALGLKPVGEEGVRLTGASPLI